ncbi:MAG: DUF2945 domain-containing protein [Pseudomonadota bacterium]
MEISFPDGNGLFGLQFPLPRNQIPTSTLSLQSDEWDIEIAEFQNGDRVQWNWGSGTGEGKIVQTYTAHVELVIKGSEVVRDASNDSSAGAMSRRGLCARR